jgi:hypothetical protein
MPVSLLQVVLSVTPQSVGELHILGIAYQLSSPAAQQSIDPLDTTPHTVSVLGKQVFTVRRQRPRSIKDRGSQDLQDRRLEINVVDSAPLLQVGYISQRCKLVVRLVPTMCRMVCCSEYFAMQHMCQPVMVILVQPYRVFSASTNLGNYGSVVDLMWPLLTPLFRLICRITKSECFLHRVFVRPAWNSSAPTGWIFMESDI